MLISYRNLIKNTEKIIYEKFLSSIDDCDSRVIVEALAMALCDMLNNDPEPDLVDGLNKYVIVKGNCSVCNARGTKICFDCTLSNECYKKVKTC